MMSIIVTQAKRHIHKKEELEELEEEGEELEEEGEEEGEEKNGH